MQQIGQWIVENQLMAGVIAGWIVYIIVAAYKHFKGAAPASVAQKQWAAGIAAVLVALGGVAASGVWDWKQAILGAFAAWTMATGIHGALEKPIMPSTTSFINRAANRSGRMYLPCLMILALCVALAAPALAQGGGIKLEVGAGAMLLRGVDATVQVGVNLGEFPSDWLWVGGHDFVLMAGKVGSGPYFIAPGLSMGENIRLGFPIWREAGQPVGDVAIFYTTPLRLGW